MRDLDVQYRDDANLAARVETHARYTVGPDLEPVVDSALALGGDEAILDVGTAAGGFPGRLRDAGHRGAIVGVDAQAGMIASARAGHPRVAFAVADAQRLPFADAAFDVVTARHMLYHVPDIAAAIAEARRVLRPGGRYVVVTNAADNMSAFWDVVEGAARREPSLAPLVGSRGGSRFSDANARELLSTSFDEVTEARVPARLEFGAIEPVERYFRSCLPGTTREDDASAMAAFRGALVARWPSSGPWLVAKTVCVYVTRARTRVVA